MTRIVKSLSVPADLAGRRLDQAAAMLLPEFSRSRLRTWIERYKHERSLLHSGAVVHAELDIPGLELTGVVTQVAWTNPHMRVYIDVTDASGKVTTWNMELTSPNSVRRQGWGPNDLKAGDKVDFEGYGGKVVESRGSLVSISKVGQGTPLFVQGGPEASNDAR